MIQHRPDIKDDDRLSATQASRALIIARGTFYAKAAKYNVVAHIPRGGGRPYYIGREVLRIWFRG